MVDLISTTRKSIRLADIYVAENGCEERKTRGEWLGGREVWKPRNERYEN